MDWSIDKSRAAYRIQAWGEGYFDIGTNGQLAVRPRGTGNDATIELEGLVERAHASGLKLPLLVRFTDILRSRIDHLHGAFTRALESAGVAASYTVIYPVKVNQQQHVVETLVKHGGARIGLECGSKPELMAVIGSLPVGGVIICNGYKDAGYIRMALIAQRLGHRVTLVVEKLSELDRIVRIADELQLQPRLGLRVRLSTVTAGNWQNSGGDRSKFGFTAAGALQLLERLRKADRLDCLTLLHCHPGSQITSIEVFRRALREVARTWVELRNAGAPVSCVDIGGGLGVDYQGTRSTGEFSMDYDIERYANEVVDVFARMAQAHRLEVPDLMSESGRALTAHHAVLITNVVDTEQVLCEVSEPGDDEAEAVTGLRDCLAQCTPENALESYRVAGKWLELLRDSYLEGSLDLSQRACGESVYSALCRKLQGLLAAQAVPPVELDEINRKLADKYFCNLSVFQSMPDVWGISQVFPIMPLQQLDQRPERRAILHDLTCDSDGHIEYYVDDKGVESSLPVHAVSAGQPYLLGFFLLGAYQEILGDMHNLFGDTDAVNAELLDDGDYRLFDPRHGDTVDELLRYVEFEPGQLMAGYREKINAAGLTDAESIAYLQVFEDGLVGTTYLEDE